MQVRLLDTENRRDVRQFVEFPYALYRGCEQWIPPLKSAASKPLQRQAHPFHRHSLVDFYVAERDGETLGRIAVWENTRYNAFHGRHDAFFGYWEMVEDAAVAHALLDTAVAWAQAHGLERLRGPRALLGPDAGGVLVEGYGFRGLMGVPYNWPYYDRLIQEAGLEVDTDLLSGFLEEGWQLPERIARIAERARQRGRLTICSFNTRDELRAIAPQVMDVYNHAFVDRLTYYPLTEAEAAFVIETLVAIADPRLIKVVMHEDRAVGFLLAYPDISAALKRCRGALWPLGWLDLTREQRRTRSLIVNGVALLPQHQGLGGNAILYAELSKTALSFGYRYAELVQVDLLNDASLADNQAAGVQWIKKHRHYVREL